MGRSDIVILFPRPLPFSIFQRSLNTLFALTCCNKRPSRPLLDSIILFSSSLLVDPAASTRGWLGLHRGGKLLDIPGEKRHVRAVVILPCVEQPIENG